MTGLSSGLRRSQYLESVLELWHCIVALHCTVALWHCGTVWPSSATQWLQNTKPQFSPRPCQITSAPEPAPISPTGLALCGCLLPSCASKTQSFQNTKPQIDPSARSAPYRNQSLPSSSQLRYSDCPSSGEPADGDPNSPASDQYIRCKPAVSAEVTRREIRPAIPLNRYSLPDR